MSIFIDIAMNERIIKRNAIYLPRLGVKHRNNHKLIRLITKKNTLKSTTSSKVIVMTLCNRPDYTNQVLRSFEECIGIEDYHMIMCVEPINDEVIKLAKAFNACLTEVVINPRRLGYNQNTFQALNRGFLLCDYVIVAEDDTVFAPDALRYFEYCRLQFENDESIFSISGYSHTTWPKSYWFDVRKVKWFHHWGWAIWKSRWLQLKDQWVNFRQETWDNDVQLVRSERYEVVPCLSRIQNIGALNGTHVPSAEWHREHHHVDTWAGNIKLDFNDSFKINTSISMVDCSSTGKELINQSKVDLTDQKPSSEVALCFSGYISSIKSTFGFIMARLVSVLFPDIFMHVWRKTEDDIKDLEWLIDNFKPKRLLVLDQVDFSNHEKLRYRVIVSSAPINEPIRHNAFNALSMFFAISQANRIKLDFEQQHNYVYKTTIRCRYDTVFNNPIDPCLCDLNQVCIPSGQDHHHGLNDQFALGPSILMNIYSSLFQNIESYVLNDNVNMHPETLLRYHLCKNEVPVSRFDNNISIMR